MPQYVVKPIGSRYTFAILLTKAGSPLLGMTPSLEIRRVRDGLYLDFAAASPPFWTTVGGQRELTLPAIPWLEGGYGWEFDHARYDAENAAEYVAIFRHTPPYRLLEFEIVTFELTPTQIALDAFADVGLIRKALFNQQEVQMLGAGHFEHRLYDDDRATIIHTAGISLVSDDTERRTPIP